MVLKQGVLSSRECFYRVLKLTESIAGAQSGVKNTLSDLINWQEKFQEKYICKSISESGKVNYFSDHSSYNLSIKAKQSTCGPKANVQHHGQ